MKAAVWFTRRRQSSQEPLKLKNRAGPYPSGAVFLHMKKRSPSGLRLKSGKNKINLPIVAVFLYNHMEVHILRLGITVKFTPIQILLNICRVSFHIIISPPGINGSAPVRQW